MKLSEILYEDTSAAASVKNIVDIITTQIPDLYRKLSRMAENYAKNHGEIDNGFNLVAGGQKAQWYNDVFFKNLKPALYNLEKGLPYKIRIELHNFLSNTTGVGSFRDIQEQLPDILNNIGVVIKNDKLVSAAKTFKATIHQHELLIEKLNTEDEDDVPMQKAPKQPNVIGQQNASVETIINDVLGRIDKKHAGDIRNIVSKSSNKLATLQQELNKRGIRL